VPPGTLKRTKWSYTTWNGRACGTHLRRKSDLGSAAAKTGSTQSTNTSTIRRPRSSNCTTKCPGDSNSKCKQGSLRKAAIRKVIFDHPSPNLRKTLSVIPINSNNTGNSKSVKSNQPSGGSRANYKQRRGFQRRSSKAERPTGNALAAAAGTTKPTLYQKYMATCSESTHKSTAVQ